MAVGIQEQEAVMIRIHLPPAEVERLEQVFRSTDDRKLRDRAQIVLPAHKGRRHQDIAPLKKKRRRESSSC